MKRFTVVWRAAAQELLAELWLAADDKAAIQSAADRIDDVLARNADSLGAETANEMRYVQVECLDVLFKVSMDDRIARVCAVRPASRP